MGVEHVILSTDFGQAKSPYSDEGILDHLDTLATQGITEDELVLMTHTNPKRMIG